MSFLISLELLTIAARESMGAAVRMLLCPSLTGFDPLPVLLSAQE
jgi:hypothetical protein